MLTNSNVEDKKDWYAIYTMPRSEKKVYNRIIESGIEAYLPLLTTVRIWSDRKKKVSLPLIPSFVFIKNLTMFKLYNKLYYSELLIKIQG